MALIEEADVDFAKGLNILSGETGAGKSILLGSIGLAMGARADKDIIRHGAESALCELTFDIEGEALIKALDELGIVPEDGRLIISRRIYDNKSVARINGETVSLGVLKSVTGLLIDIYGQHENQSLLKRERQIGLLDDFANADTAEVARIFGEYTQLTKKLSSMDIDEEGRRRQMSYLEYAIGEIEAAKLVPGEEEQLLAQYKKLTNAAAIREKVSEAYELLGGRGGASDAVEESIRAINTVLSYDDELAPVNDQLLDAEAMMADLLSAASSYMEGLTVDDEELQNVQTRLDVIENMKQKYGRSIEAVLESLEKYRNEYEQLERFDEEKADAQIRLEECKKQLAAECGKLTKVRCEAAGRLEKLISASLSEMNFLDNRFEIAFSEKEPSHDGADAVQFLIATNPGEALKPLEKVASGGELSRIMLAFKTVFADTYHIDTLIFDEIDAGISGVTASCVCRKLQSVAKNAQVICISHLPQIVAGAQTHFLIEKGVRDEKTYSDIKKLDGEASVMEVARLLGGDHITESTIESARELIRSSEVV